MYEFARGVQDLHEMNYFHLNINLSSLVVSYCEKSQNSRGFLSDFSLAAATTRAAPLRTAGDETRRLPLEPCFSRASRGDPEFRAPENFFLFSGKDIFPHDPKLAGEQFFSVNEKSDVWSLGICFIVILTGRRPFEIKDSVPNVSRRGLERLRTLWETAQGNDPNLYERAVKAECARWQTYHLFGSTLPSDREGDETRRHNIAIMINDALTRSALPELTNGASSAIQDLLWRMLTPATVHRATISDVVTHPLFSQFYRAEAANVAKAPRDPPPSLRQFAPRGGWTMDKDIAVLRAVRALITEPEVGHLPIEAVFVAYDLAARVAGSFDSPVDADLINAATAAAVRVAIELYDISQSIGGGLTTENSLSRQLTPFVVEFFGGLIRHTDYIFKFLSDTEDIRDILTLFVETTPAASAFRKVYLILDSTAAAAALVKRRQDLSGTNGLKRISVAGPVSNDVCFQPSERNRGDIAAMRAPTIADMFHLSVKRA
jgi:hypothetical protein